MNQNTFAQTNVRLPAPLIRDLKKSAAEEGKSLARVIRELGEAYVRGSIKLNARARQSDPIWTIHSRAVRTGRTDLASRIDEIVYGA